MKVFGGPGDKRLTDPLQVIHIYRADMAQVIFFYKSLFEAYLYFMVHALLLFVINVSAPECRQHECQWYHAP